MNFDRELQAPIDLRVKPDGYVWDGRGITLRCAERFPAFLTSGRDIEIKDVSIQGASTAIEMHGRCVGHRYSRIRIWDCISGVSDVDNSDQFVWWDCEFRDFKIQQFREYGIRLWTRQGGSSGSLLESITIGNRVEDESQPCIAGISLQGGDAQVLNRVNVEWCQPRQAGIELNRISAVVTAARIEGVDVSGTDAVLISLLGERTELTGDRFSLRSCKGNPLFLDDGARLGVDLVADNRRNSVEEA